MEARSLEGWLEDWMTRWVDCWLVWDMMDIGKGIVGTKPQI